MNIMKKILCVFCLAVFSLGGILTIILPDKEFSEEENRILQQSPQIDAKSIINGDFQQQINEYLTDQMILRSGFMRVYALTQKTLGKSEYNGIYVCDDNWIIETYKETENTEQIAEKFRKIADNANADCTIMLVPTAVSVYDEVLPPNVSFKTSQRDVCDYIYENCGMSSIDLWNVFEENKDKTQLFYKTDHHWTTDAAFLAYQQYCIAMDIEPLERDFFDITTVSDDFYGTTYSKALTAFQKADEITVYKQDMSGITVTYPSGTGDLYAEGYLDKKDKYSYFLNSNQPQIVIDNENVSNGKVLLVVKDSYANCLVPFLVNHYEKIIVLDTRYYRNGVTNAAESFNATDIFFCFNLNTLDTDTAISGIY